jgi:hypothetical protein
MLSWNARKAWVYAFLADPQVMFRITGSYNLGLDCFVDSPEAFI